jgi:AraC-like DNA-binding protein
MKDLRADLAEIIADFAPADGFHTSPVPGVHCIKFSHSDHPTKRHWRASLGIVVQGCKEIALGEEIYRFDDAHYIAVPVDLPVTSRIFSASREKPFLSLLIDFDALALTEVAAQLDAEYPMEIDNSLRAVFIGEASEKMLDAAIRLGKLFQAPEDAAVLAPLVIKEIIYYLLKGNDGAAIRQFVRRGSKMHKISQAIYKVRAELSEEVDVAALARDANMSRSAFFKHFNEMTAMSPIQYQKRLRLLEARRLMIDEGETAESSAFRVGYRSSSQFSREYSSMFGNAPLRDTMKIKKTGVPILQI